MKNPLETLTSLFRDFPGIGPRQAERFTYHLLGTTGAYRKKLAEEIENLSSLVLLCPSCLRFHAGPKNPCNICSDKGRDEKTLMIVAKDTDLATIEKSHAYRGMYFVLGGSVPLLDKNPEDRIRLKELKKHIESTSSLSEIVFALNVNPEGEYTREIVEEQIQDLVGLKSITLSILGRGLSTGTEIEYSDSDTLKSALLHRTPEKKRTSKA